MMTHLKWHMALMFIEWDIIESLDFFYYFAYYDYNR